MGEKYFIKIKCAYCGKLNPKKPKESGIWMEDYIMYAESCGFTTFKCDYCGKENQITMKFEAKKSKK